MDIFKLDFRNDRFESKLHIVSEYNEPMAPETKMPGKKFTTDKNDYSFPEYGQKERATSFAIKEETLLPVKNRYILTWDTK